MKFNPIIAALITAPANIDINVAAVVTGISGLVLALLAVWKAFKTQHVEVKKEEVSLATTFENIANLSAEKALKLASRVECLEEDVDKLRDELRDRDMQIEDLKDWANRLVHQVASMGGTPVGFIDRRKKPDEPSK